jgi:uncharacterized protein
VNADAYSDEEKTTLLKLGRKALEMAARGEPLPEIDLAQYSEKLRENGASFVTLTEYGQLRGCIGTLQAYQPLVQDVCEHARAAGFEDYRFPPVRAEEIPRLVIEISILTSPQQVIYNDPGELESILRPGVDGVILKDGQRRATFLPQVWEKVPETQEFLSHLCMKMGVSANLWRQKVLQVYTYQVVEFHE